MFPNSGNTSLTLLRVFNKLDDLGNKQLVILSAREVIGIAKSITSSEFQSSVMMNLKFEFKVLIQAFLYDGSKYAKVRGQIYKIERTYVNGQFIELFLISTTLKEEDFSEE